MIGHCYAKLPSLEELNQSSYQLKEAELSKWFIPNIPKEKINSLALVTHGLNLKPSRMNSIIEALKSKGVLVLRLALKGHRGSLQEQGQVKLSDWVNQYRSAIEILRQYNLKKNLPLYSLSYSLGSEVHLNALTFYKEQIFNKSVFFAPALWSYWYTGWPALPFFLPDNFGIKSMNHQDYRSEESTSMAAYRALQEGKNNWNEFAEKKNFKMLEPFLVILDPKDELISIDKIKNFTKENPDIKAQLFVLKNFKPTITPSFHHLIIDKWAVGQKQWQAIEEAIFSYLDL